SLVASTVSSAISSITPAAKTASAALFSGTSFVDGEIAAVQVSAVKRIDRVLRLFGRAHGDESEAAGASSGAIRHEVCLGNSAMRREDVLQIVFGGIERKVPNE